MKYKFVDIGCSFWEVSTDDYGTNVNGLLVDPVKAFIDVLPESPTLKKANVAIGDKEQEVELDVYMPKDRSIIRYYQSKHLERIYEKYKKEDKLAIVETHPILGAIIGCGGTSLFDRNDISCEFHEKVKVKVKMITLEQLFDEYEVTEIDMLKIDVEGLEESIIEQLLPLMRNGKVKVNNIRYECNYMSDEDKLKDLGHTIAEEFGYKYEYIHVAWDQDIWLTQLP